jgi:hypothetical protein
MERYDAILEQLKQAQRRGLDTISNRLDFVVQTLDGLIQEAKTSVQEALPQTADECLPVDEVEKALRAFRDEAEAERVRVADLEARIEELEGGAGASDVGASVELLRALDGAQSQSELLKELLPAISEHAARAVVLVLRDGNVSAWSGIGFTDGERLRGWKGAASDSSALSTLIDHSSPVRFTPEEDEFFGAWLTGEETPSEIILVPVVLRGKLMGAVYVDRLDGQPWNPETAQSLVAQVCWLIDTLPFRPEATPTLAVPVSIVDRIVDESPSESDRVSDPYAVTAAISPEEEASEETERETADEPVMEADEPPADDQEVDPSATMKIDLSEMPAAAAPIEDEAVTDAIEPPESASFEPEEPTVDTETEITAETFEPDEPAEPDVEPEIATESFEPEEPVQAEFEAAADEVAEEPIEEEPAETAEAAPETAPTAVQMPVTPPDEVAEAEPEVEHEEAEDETESSSAPKFLDEPPPVQPVQPPPEEPEEEISEDEAQQEEARRFARLLVSEIKLYNEEQVERGRQAKDLYNRLKEDIDRSREMFENAFRRRSATSRISSRTSWFAFSPMAIRNCSATESSVRDCFRGPSC